ncbi:MAG: 2-aminobenzoate-CoA ligase, partial [Fimbriimonadaceae bacterium]|nr:2-aminobenzoate-CoA ligase [Fimbriimonadaceae bacterium]
MQTPPENVKPSAGIKSAYTDTFAADNLPPRELWPTLINLDKLGYPEQLNCASE